MKKRLHISGWILCLCALLMPAAVTGLFQNGPEVPGKPWPWDNYANPKVVRVPVCFRPPGTKPDKFDPNITFPTTKYTQSEWMAKRAMVRDALETSWQKWTMLRFVNWGDCPANPAGFMYVDLIKNDCGGCGDALPRGGYHAGGVNIWMMTENGDERLLRTVTIHEFGHALGFHHEMDRQDAKFPNGTPKCNDGPVTVAGIYLTPYYDDVSVMNYCAPRNRNGLSAGDIDGAQVLYGKSQEDGWAGAVPVLNLFAM
ncbi:MAG: M57 family metalloprotease [Gammaproteobacteria bacterium]|nr:M57 family metalloprotease [Gammaproteobacteria bacterium]MDH5654093.1 M57 family metalloprotease [Gammaproteobacteria bacterium]